VPDLTTAILPILRSHRLPDIDLGADALHPHYTGLSILNLAASIEQWFGLPPGTHAPLAIEALASMASDARQVVVCLLDALSFSRFTGWLDGPGRALQPLVAAGLLAPLTSVVPSTTASALTTLWTGRSPAEHGILGYELLLREYGLIANMITLAPAAFDNQRGLLERAGVHRIARVPTRGPSGSVASARMLPQLDPQLGPVAHALCRHRAPRFRFTRRPVAQPAPTGREPAARPTVCLGILQRRRRAVACLRTRLGSGPVRV
jgi:hypothetical protein